MCFNKICLNTIKHNSTWSFSCKALRNVFVIRFSASVLIICQHRCFLCFCYLLSCFIQSKFMFCFTIKGSLFVYTNVSSSNCVLLQCSSGVCNCSSLLYINLNWAGLPLLNIKILNFTYIAIRLF